MITPRKEIFLPAVVMLSFICLQATIGMATEKTLLEQRIEHLVIKEQDIKTVLSGMAHDYGIPIGLELAPTKNKSDEQLITINVQNKTLREVLEIIIKQSPNYQWAVTGEVVNFYPKTNRDEFLEDLLKTRVGNFIIPVGMNRLRMREAITNIPEVKSKLEVAKVTPTHLGFTGADFRRVGEEFALNLSNVTLRDILNQIVCASDSKFWIVNRWGEHNEFLIVNF